MSSGTSNSSDMVPAQPPAPSTAIISSSAPIKQLQDLPKDELNHVAEDLGIDAAAYSVRQKLVAAIHERRQLIAAMDRESMLDVVRWGRRPVAANASKEQLAIEITRIKSMRFAGLSQQGLLVLAIMRNIPIKGDEDVPALFGRVGVVRHDGDLAGHRLLERPAHRVGVVGRDEDRVLALLDERVEVGDLRGRGRVGRPDLLRLGAELPGPGSFDGRVER